MIYTVQVVSKKIRCATKNTGEVLERSRPIDHCFGCHWVLLHRVPPMAMSKPAPSEAKRHVRICPAQPILTLAVHAGGFCKKLPSYLFKQRWVRGLIKLYRIEVDKWRTLYVPNVFRVSKRLARMLMLEQHPNPSFGYYRFNHFQSSQKNDESPSIMGIYWLYVYIPLITSKEAH